MALETFSALLLFALVTSITPGPNTMMLFASGVNFGFRRTFPHMCGIGLGFFSLLLGVGFGLGAVLERYPAFYLALKVVGGGYLLWIAWKIGTSRALPNTEGQVNARPMTVIGAALFQWVNPKAWIMAIAAVAAYTDPADYTATMLWIAVAFTIVNFPAVSVWAGFGSAMRGWLSEPTRLKYFNISMAILLVVSLWPMLR
jgi:Putative threonine efflux protein